MKRWAPLGSAILAIAVVGALQAKAAGTAQQGQQLKLHVKAQTVNIVNNPPTGKYGAGDELLVAEVVTKNGKTVGRTVLTQTTINDQGDTEMEFTIRLPKGDIVYGGMHLKKQTTDHFAILGGTGAYSDARGFVVTKPTPNKPTEHDLTFNLQ